MKANKIILALLLFCNILLLADTPETANLTVIAPENCSIYLNDQLIATESFENLAILPGEYQLSAYPSENLTWSLRSFRQDFTVMRGETRNLTITFPELVTITSEPYGATVFAGNRILGTTPLVVEKNKIMSHENLTLKKDGYAEIIADPVVHPGLNFTLEPVSGNIPGHVLKATPDRQQNTTLKTSLIITSFVSSWGAFYLKREADSNFDKYSRSGNPNEMQKYFDRTERFDNFSDIALAVSVGTLGTFIYMLLSE